MINPRLFDWYGIDTTKDLKIKSICGRPFNTILIDKNGSCFACECTSWLPQSVGNLQKLELEEIIDSDLTRLMRASVSNGTYRYCNEKQCPYILSKYIDNAEYNLYNELKHIRLALDDSCNLSCPSCRQNKIFLYRGKMFDMRLKLVDKVIKYIHNNQQRQFNIHIGSDGDPFASLIYRNFMRRTDVFKNLTYSVLTNGLLIKKKFNKFRHVIDNLNILGISVDGASKHTYEKLRRGGSFEKLLENLEFIKNLDRKFKLELHCVIQKENYQEMSAIVDLAEKYGADRIWLNKITNWNTFTDFESKNITNPAHPDYQSYLKILQQLKDRSKTYVTRFIEMPTLDI